MYNVVFMVLCVLLLLAITNQEKYLVKPKLKVMKENVMFKIMARMKQIHCDGSAFVKQKRNLPIYVRKVTVLQ